jgi:hypothetical protein
MNDRVRRTAHSVPTTGRAGCLKPEKAARLIKYRTSCRSAVTSS